MTPNELVQIGTDIVNQANAQGADIRLFGGVAVLAHCPSLQTHEKLQREYHDLDLVAPVGAWKILPDLMISRGLHMNVKSSGRATFTREDLTVDVRGTTYREYYTLNLLPRLHLDPLTVPVADLLLYKLQRVQMAEKDIQDAIALLLDHPVADGGDAETIDREYLYKLTNTNWGLWTTVYDNTVMLEKTLDRYLETKEAQLVWRRIEQIQEVMDGKGKSLGWWLRWILKKRVKWYNEPAKETQPEPLKVRM